MYLYSPYAYSSSFSLRNMTAVTKHRCLNSSRNKRLNNFLAALKACPTPLLAYRSELTINIRINGINYLFCSHKPAAVDTSHPANAGSTTPDQQLTRAHVHCKPEVE